MFDSMKHIRSGILETYGNDPAIQIESDFWDLWSFNDMTWYD